MAAAKGRPAKGKPPKKGIVGRMPTKQSINLVLPDSKKINFLVAIPAILLIVAFAAVFSKFMVYDRIMAVYAAENKVSQLRTQVDDTLDAIESIGDVEDTYAHYTIQGMTLEELGLVNRVDVLNLVHTVLIANSVISPEELNKRVTEVGEALGTMRADAPDCTGMGLHVRLGLDALLGLRRESLNETTRWSLSGNELSVNVVGRSLEHMNEIARMLEQDPIVDSCVVTTANKNRRASEEEAERVTAQFRIYLRQPVEEEVAQS